MWPRRILVPVDFSTCSRAAVEWASALAQATGATVDVLHVWPAQTLESLSVTLHEPGESARTLAQMPGLRASTEAEMERFLSLTEYPSVTRGRVEAGDPVGTIVRVAAEGYDLLVLGTHGRGGVERLLLGSVAERVIRRAPCSVAVIPPRR